MIDVLSIAMKYASKAEKEVERLMKDFLTGTPYAGKVKAVGGYVRDQFLEKPGLDPDDLDMLVTEQGGAEGVTRYLHDNLVNSEGKSPVSTPHAMGKGYPIWEIIFKSNVVFNGETYGTEGAKIQFAEPMKESYPDPSSRQRVVEPATVEEDIARRDFTVNMLLRDMTSGEIEDLTGVGKDDIKKGILKGHPKVDPDKMFSDDPLRMIRLIRFHVKYGWRIPKFMVQAVKRNAERIEIVSAERIMGELKKVTVFPRGLEKAVWLMNLTGLLKHVLPEIEALKGVEQSKKYHQEGDAYRHTLMVLRNAPPGLENQIGALLHDVGKPQSTEILGDVIKSHGHDEVGAEMAEAILTRLKFETPVVQRVKMMVKNHMRPHLLTEDRDKQVSVKALRRFIRDVGEELVDAVLDLSRADELGRIPSINNIPDLRAKIDEVRKGPSVSAKPVLNGKEIMDLLSLKTGPDVGRATKELTEIGDEYAEQGKELTKELAKEELKKRFKKASGVISLATVIRSITEDLS